MAGKLFASACAACFLVASPAFAAPQQAYQSAPVPAAPRAVPAPMPTRASVAAGVAPATSPDQAHWRDLVPERKDSVIESVAFGRGLMAVTYLHNASNVVEVFDLLPNAQLAVLPGTTHVGVTQRHREVLALITPFLDAR